MAFLRLRKLLLGVDAGIFEATGAPTDGTSGTFAGVAGPSSLLLRRDSGVVYINTNTKASPSWKAITHA